MKTRLFSGRATFRFKKGVSLQEGLQVLSNTIEENERIEADHHTNKHYELRKGIIWKKGDGTGKYWDLLCNSRRAQKQAHEMLRLG